MGVSGFIQRRGQAICPPSHRNDRGDSAQQIIQEDAEGLPSGRRRNSAECNGTGPVNPCTNSATIYEKGGRWEDASHAQPTRIG